jgi:tetratricopeptide (TPR) repeat protein
LLALVVDSRLTHNRARYIILPIAFLFACLSHEIALIFLIILPIWHLARRRMTLLPLADYLKYQKESGNLLIYGALALTLCGYLAIRYAALGYLMTPIEVDLGNTLQRVLLFGRSLFEYILLTIFPFTRLSPYHYRTLPLSATDLAAWISLIMILMAGAGIVRMVRTRPRPGWLFFAGFITILSISNVIPMSLPGNAFVAERFLLFPIALFILAAVSLIRPLRERINGFSATETTTARSLVTIWFLASLVTIQLIIPNWTDNLSLWNWAVRGTRNSTYPHLNLAREYINQSRYELGLAAADYALEIDPSDGEAWNIAGVALISLRNFDEARVVLEKATELQPDNALYWNNLAAAHRELGEFERAEQLLLQESLSRDPNLAIGYINLTMVYLKAGRPDLASQVLKSIQETLPQIQSTEIENLVSQTEEPDRWLELGGTLLSLGEAESALQAFEQAETLGASKVDVVAGKAEALIRLERWSQVEALILTALEETPNDARFEYALGIVAQERGNMEDAQNHYQRAAILAPDWELPQQKLEELEVVNGGNQAP